MRVQYIDYVGSWGPAIVGHAHPEVTEALTEQIKKVRGQSAAALCQHGEEISLLCSVCVNVRTSRRS